MRERSTVIGAIVLVLTALPSSGEVKVAAADRFQVEVAVETGAPPERVYQALVGEVGRWWHPDHTYSGNPANLSIEGVPGGCFCERFPEGGGASHLTVVFAKPGAVLRMVGGLGPLQGGALAGALTFVLTKRESGSTVEARYLASGFHTPPLDQWAPAVDRVLTLQLQRLARYLATGSPEPAPEKLSVGTEPRP